MGILSRTSLQRHDQGLPKEIIGKDGQELKRMNKCANNYLMNCISCYLAICMVFGLGCPTRSYALDDEDSCLSSHIEQFSTLDQLPADTLRFVQPVQEEKSLYAKGEFREIVEKFDGDELHIVAAGGGGDLKGAIVLARQMVRILNERPGKTKVTKVKLLTSNLKRGEENPIGGPTPMEHIYFEKEGVTTRIKPLDEFSPFYELSDEKYYVASSVYTEDDLLSFAFNDDNAQVGQRPQEPIRIQDKKIKQKQSLFENDIVAMIKDRKIDDTEMSIIITDCERSGQELAMYYRKMIAGRDEKVLTIGLDVGGDIMARFPIPIGGDVTHPEYEVRSPNTDAVFLDMFAELEAKRPMNTILAISALGGDGELGRIIVNYLAEMQTANMILGVIDNAYYFSKRQEEIQWAIDELGGIPSEVSTNFINSIRKVLDEHNGDGIVPIDPNDVRFTYQEEAEPNQPLRGRSRYEFKPRHYLNTIFVKASSLKEKIVDIPLRGEGKEWYATDHYIRNRLNYLTEMNDPNNVLARLRQNMAFLKDALNAKDGSGNYVYDEGSIFSLLKTYDSVIVKLAVLLVACERDKDMESRKQILNLLEQREARKDIYEKLPGATLLTAVVLEAFGQAVIITGKPLSPYEADIVTNYVRQPIKTQDPLLRGFDYWSIQDEALEVLQLNGAWNGWAHVRDGDMDMADLLEMRNNSVGQVDETIEMFAGKMLNKAIASLDHDQDDILQAISKRIRKKVNIDQQNLVWDRVFVLIYDEIEQELNRKTFSTSSDRCDSRMKVSKLYSLLAKMCEMIMKSDREKEGVLPLDIGSNMSNKRYHTASDKLIDLLAVSNIRSDIVLKSSIHCFKMLALRYIQRNAKEYLNPRQIVRPIRFVRDSVRVESPGRLGIMRGGEVDYYGINETEGSHAINAAITFTDHDGNQAMPLEVVLEKTPYEHEISFWFYDSKNKKPEYRRCRSRHDVLTFDRDGSALVNDCFNLFKQIIVSMGIVTHQEHRRLNEVLDSLGGGLTVNVTARMPIGSGLGLVSGLALAYVEALSAMIGITISDTDKYRICAYALNSVNMTTAWQDLMTVGEGGVVELRMAPHIVTPSVSHPQLPGIMDVFKKNVVLMYFSRQEKAMRTRENEIEYDREMRFIVDYFLAHHKTYKTNKAKFNAIITLASEIMLTNASSTVIYPLFCEVMRDYIELAEEIIPYYRQRSEGIQRQFTEALINSPSSPFLYIYKPSGFGTRGGVYVFFLKEGKTKSDAQVYINAVKDKLSELSDSKEERNWLTACEMLSFQITAQGTHIVSEEQSLVNGGQQLFEAA
jgi:mevalonate kinase